MSEPESSRNNNEPLVSIVAPVYKIHEEYLRQCIESLSAQTYANIEMLLVDDDSPDNCGAICDEYAAKDSRIRPIHQENQGVSVARNNGINAARGEYLIFVDSDDWIEPDCVETVLAEIQRQKVDVLYFQRVIEAENEKQTFSGKSRVLDRKEVIELQHSIIKVSRLEEIDAKPPWGKIIRTDFLRKYALTFPPGVKKAQDVVFNLYLTEHLKKAYYLDYTGYHYRLNQTSVNYRYNPEMPDIILFALSCMFEFVKEYHTDDTRYLSELGFRAANMITTAENVYFFHSESTLSLRDVVRRVAEYYGSSLVRECILYARLKDFPTFKGKIKLLLVKHRRYRLYCLWRSFKIRFDRMWGPKLQR